MSKQSRIPSNRISRMYRLGKIASGVATVALGEGIKRLVKGEIPKTSELLLTPGNATRIADQLSQMRGAVMKIGQLLSMEAGDILPKDLTDILSKLRESAHAMPAKDLEKVLQDNWGGAWRDKFDMFDEHVFAAASIGQVHEAVDKAGRHLAIKIQYPGIAKSIDSDVDNAASILKLFKLIPPTLDIQPLLDIAKRQLHDEANYQLEAQYLNQYRECLGEHNIFHVPEVIEELSTNQVLVMSYVEGQTIENLTFVQPDLRNQMATHIIDLSLKEFLHWGMVQTDPNFANFRFNQDKTQVGLLDFGALRINEKKRTKAFSQLLYAAMQEDLFLIVEAACVVGYIKRNDPFDYRMAIADLIQTAAEPALHQGDYDFGMSNLSQRMTEKLYQLRSQKDFQRIPPADVIFLHRKLAGIYLLCAKIRAKVNVRKQIENIFDLQLADQSV